MWWTANAGATAMPGVEGRAPPDTRSAIPSGAALAVYLVLACLFLVALRNVYTYRQALASRWEETRRLTQLLDQRVDVEQVPGGARDLQVRRDLYSLLLSLGNDSLQNGQKSAVVVADPEFHRGAYIDRPLDTILDRCAIQPFTVPALTGMPLLGGLGARGTACRYDSYGYQYLPKRPALSTSELDAPCTHAREGGFDSVFVIDRHDAGFSARKVDCARH